MGRKVMTVLRVITAVYLIFSFSNAFADPDVIFITPKDGAVIKQGESIPVQYSIKPWPRGDHSHIYIDHKESGILRHKKATFPINPLPVGEHSLCLKVVNKAHAPIGQETCISISVK